MSLEQKIEYYERYYEENGLPDEMKAKDFFNDEFLDYLLKNKYGFIEINYIDFEELLRDPILFNKTIHLLLNSFSTQIDSSNFYELLVNNSNLFNYISHKIINNDIEDLNFHKLLNDNRTLELLKPLSQNNISFFVRMLEYQSTDKLKNMLIDSVWKNVYFYVNYDIFFYNINKLGLDIVGIEYLNKKLNSLDYNQTIEVLTKYYDSEKGEPYYLQETYKIYENEIRKNKIGKLLEGLNKNSSEETISNVKDLISTDV